MTNRVIESRRIHPVQIFNRGSRRIASVTCLVTCDDRVTCAHVCVQVRNGFKRQHAGAGAASILSRC